MCTLVLRLAPGEKWPLLVGANRDEMVDRPFDPPAAHWPERPDVVGGRDRLAGGTWLAVNAACVVAGVLNRPGALGPEAGKRSRGVLPLIALDHRTAEGAAAALRALDAAAWRPFNLVVADRRHAFFCRGIGGARAAVVPLVPGVHMVTAHDPDDETSPRIARHLPRFRAAPPPGPPDWSSWTDLLADDAPPREAAIAIRPIGGFATTSSALVAIGQKPVFLFANGFPGDVSYAPVVLHAPEIVT